jgi:hypothetical protein
MINHYRKKNDVNKMVCIVAVQCGMLQPHVQLARVISFRTLAMAVLSHHHRQDSQ